MPPNLPPCPPQLKIIQHYLKLAADYESRNSAISYWARLYALQSAMKVDRSSPEAKSLLISIMDHLEKFKKEHASNEGISSDVAGQALIENEAHKLFTKADAADRQGFYDKNVVKAFYTAGILMDVCEVFGDLPEELSAQRKYSKWKATYIHNCLKSGETPVPGPPESEDGPELQVPSAAPRVDSPVEYSQHVEPSEPAGAYSIAEEPAEYVSPPAVQGLKLTSVEYAKAQKYCKYAISSIDYEDPPTAISYLEKALRLLTTGEES